jgi:hypothetical protein
MIGALEFLPICAPRRRARIEDFAVDMLATCTCVGVAFVAGLSTVSRPPVNDS